MNLKSRCLFNVFLSFLLFVPSCLLAYIVFCILNPWTPVLPSLSPSFFVIFFVPQTILLLLPCLVCVCVCVSMCVGGGDLCIYIKSGNHKWDKRYFPFFFHLFFRILSMSNFLNFLRILHKRILHKNFTMLHHFCPSIFLLPPAPPVSPSLHLKFMSSSFLIIVT